jgi:fructan beta-fructosidase
LNAGQNLPLASAGDLFRVQAEVTFDASAALTLNVRGTKLLLNRQSMMCGAKPVPISTALTSFEVLVDRTSVEAFANDGEASLSKCFLPTESGLSVKATVGRVSIKRLKLVHLKSAWQ